MAATNIITAQRSLSWTIDFLVDMLWGKDTRNIGTNSNEFPTGNISWSYGSGANQFNKLVCGKVTISAGANSDLDLAGSLTGADGPAGTVGSTITFTGVKWMHIAVGSPDGSKKVRVGNEGTNPFNGPLSSGGTIDIVHSQDFVNPSTGGWSVTAGTGDKLRLNNPGGSSIDVYYMIGGI